MDGTDGVIYLMIGGKHAEHLAVSLYSLRQHWEGEVAILVGDDQAAEFCKPMAAVDGVRLVRFDYMSLKATRRGSGNTYLAKSNMHRMTPFDRTVFLDADTLVVGDISPLFPEPGRAIITRWMDWTTQGKMMSGRLRGWLPYAKPEAERQLAEPWSAINTGVIGFTRESAATMDAWNEMTARNVSFICDEIAMQLIFPDWPVDVLDDRFNASPCYPDQWQRHGYPLERLEDLDCYGISVNGDVVPVVPEHTRKQMRDISSARSTPSDVRVWHGHGFKFIKKPFGRAVWWPVYREAVKANFCRMAEWTPWNATRWRRCKLVSYLNNPHQWQ